MLPAPRRRLRNRRAHFAQPKFEHMLERTHDEFFFLWKMMQLRAARDVRTICYLGGRGARVSTLEKARHGRIKQPPPRFSTPLILQGRHSNSLLNP